MGPLAKRLQLVMVPSLRDALPEINIVGPGSDDKS